MQKHCSGAKLQTVTVTKDTCCHGVTSFYLYILYTFAIWIMQSECKKKTTTFNAKFLVFLYLEHVLLCCKLYVLSNWWMLFLSLHSSLKAACVIELVYVVFICTVFSSQGHPINYLFIIYTAFWEFCCGIILLIHYGTKQGFPLAPPEFVRSVYPYVR